MKYQLRRHGASWPDHNDAIHLSTPLTITIPITLVTALTYPHHSHPRSRHHHHQRYHSLCKDARGTAYGEARQVNQIHLTNNVVVACILMV